MPRKEPSRRGPFVAWIHCCIEGIVGGRGQGGAKRTLDVIDANIRGNLHVGTSIQTKGVVEASRVSLSGAVSATTIQGDHLKVDKDANFACNLQNQKMRILEEGQTKKLSAQEMDASRLAVETLLSVHGTLGAE